MKRYLNITIIFVVLLVNLTGCITTTTTTEKTTVPVTNTVTETLIKNLTTTEKTTLTATTTSLSTVTTTATNNITTSIINNITTTATTSLTTTVTKTITTTATSTVTSVVTTGLPITSTTSTIVVTPVGTTVTAPLSIAAAIPGGIGPIQETHTINITVLEVVRGSKAFDMLKAADASNDFPKNGYEYLLARVKFVYGPEGNLIYTLIKDYFRAYSSDNKEYTTPSIIEPKPALIGSVLYPAKSTEGWVTFMVAQIDSKPVMIYTGTASWFQLY
jgi:hypothetical protein